MAGVGASPLMKAVVTPRGTLFSSLSSFENNEEESVSSIFDAANGRNFSLEPTNSIAIRSLIGINTVTKKKVPAEPQYAASSPHGSAYLSFIPAGNGE